MNHLIMENENVEISKAVDETINQFKEYDWT